MMKQKILFVLTALLTVGTAGAQENDGWRRWSVTPRVGLNMSDFAGSDKPDWVKAKAGYAFGVEAEYRWSRWLGVSVGVEWSVMNHKNNETARMLVMLPSGDEPVQVFNIYDNSYDGPMSVTGMDIYCDCISLRYLNVPVMLNAHVWKGLTVRAGVQLGDLIAARAKGTTTTVMGTMPAGVDRAGSFERSLTSEVMGWEGRRPEPLSGEGLTGMVRTEEDLDKGMRSQCRRGVDVAIPVEVGYEWRGVMLSVGYQFGLRDVDGTDDTLHNRNLSIRLGYRIGL